MKMKWKVAFIATVGMVLPVLVQAQTIGDEVDKLHTVLENLYNEMIPLCKDLITVAQGIAGFGATFYIGYRVWKHIANAEAIDFYPLFRPFVLIILIGIFPTVLSVLRGVLKPTELITAKMVKNSNDAVKKLTAQREAAIKATKKWQVLVGESGLGDRKEWFKYTHPEDKNGEGFFESIGNDFVFAWQQFEYNIKYLIKLLISQILQILYYAAALCIDTIRTFHLVVLAILGPLVFGLAVYDGFQHSLSVWLARYINIYMWLPCANLFGSIIGRIQENMIKIDLAQIEQSGDSFFTSTDAAYLIFMVIAIIGYFTIPSVANYIVHASGGSALLSKVTNLTSNSSRMVSSADAMVSDTFSGGHNKMTNNMASSGLSGGYFDNSGSSSSNYQHHKLKGS